MMVTASNGIEVITFTAFDISFSCVCFSTACAAWAIASDCTKITDIRVNNQPIDLLKAISVKMSTFIVPWSSTEMNKKKQKQK